MSRQKEREAALSLDFVRSILSYDPQTGIFRWKQRTDRDAAWNARYAGTVAGVVDGNYIYITIGFPVRFAAHRLAWFYVYGVWPKHEVDHRNLVKTDNRLGNLREATRGQNAHNMKLFKNNTTGAKGVGFDRRRGKYRAQIKLNGKAVWFRRFDTIEEAIEARRNELHRLHGEYANEGD